jgi:hypothetical protein
LIEFTHRPKVFVDKKRKLGRNTSFFEQWTRIILNEEKSYIEKVLLAKKAFRFLLKKKKKNEIDKKLL